jgi:hypothetical protein
MTTVSLASSAGVTPRERIDFSLHDVDTTAQTTKPPRIHQRIVERFPTDIMKLALFLAVDAQRQQSAAMRSR